MKIILCLVLVIHGQALGYRNTSALFEDCSYDSLWKLLEMTTENCYEDRNNTIKVEVTKGSFDALLVYENVPRNTKCLRLCMLKFFDVFVDEWRIDVEKTAAFFAKSLPKSVDKQRLERVVRECKEISEKVEDLCERAHSMGICTGQRLDPNYVPDES